MKVLILTVMMLFVFCSKSPMAVETPFTVCNTVANRNVDVSTGIISGGRAIPQGLICTLNGVECAEINMPDGTIIVCVTNTGTYANIAHKGEYWDL